MINDTETVPCIIEWQPIFKEVTGGFAVVLRKFQIPENFESFPWDY